MLDPPYRTIHKHSEGHGLTPASMLRQVYSVVLDDRSLMQDHWEEAIPPTDACSLVRLGLLET